jgi:hypothetical protein
MDPARTLVDVKKSVETKPNPPPGILLRELPSGRALGVLLHGAPIGSAPGRSCPPPASPLGVLPRGPDSILVPILREPDRCFTAGSSFGGLRAYPLEQSFGTTPPGCVLASSRSSPRGSLPRRSPSGDLQASFGSPTGGPTARRAPPGVHHAGVRGRTIRLRRIRQVSDPIRAFDPTWWRHPVVPTPSVGSGLVAQMR